MNSRLKQPHDSGLITNLAFLSKGFFNSSVTAMALAKNDRNP
jgi:hypothetical protein